MILWLIGILLMGGLGAAGKWVGAMRFGIGLIGLWLGLFLGYTQSPKLWEVVAKQNYANPLIMWVMPIVAIFAASALIFIIIGVLVHLKVMYFIQKNRPDDKRVMVERMNSGTGITLGVLYGATLFVTFCLATLQLGYWGIQLRNGGDNSPLVKVFGKSYEWLQGSGLVKTVRGLDPLPIYYYNVADCVGLLYQNPSASRRLEQHPESMILAEMPQFQSIAKNDSFKNTFRGKPNIDELLKHDASYNAFIDRNLPNTLSTVDWVDVYGFLATGKSEKWGNHSLMGRWEVSILDTVVAASKKVNPSDENAVVKLKFLQKAMGLMVSDLELLVNANDEVHLKGSIESAADLKGLVSGRPSRQLITKVLKRIQSGAKAAQPKPQAPQENEFGEVMMDDPDAVGGEAPAGGGGGASGGNMLESGELHGSSSPFTANWSDGTQGRMTVEGNLVRVEYGGGVIVFERVE